MVRPVYQDPNRKSVESRSKAYDSTQLHKDDDVDSGRTAHHHTLGTGAGQAAPGDALATLLERVEMLETMLNTPPTDFQGVPDNSNVNSLMGIPGVTKHANFTIGTNFASKQGYTASIYFNVTNNVAIAATATGDIGNIAIIDNLPLDLRPVLNDHVGHSVNGIDVAPTSGASHLVVTGSSIQLVALHDNYAWNAGSGKSFGVSYLTRTWGWNI